MARKVAFIATVYLHLRNFHLPYMKALQDKGYEVHAYAAPGIGKDDVLRLGVVCHDVPFSRFPFAPINMVALYSLTKNFKEERYNLIHLHTPVAGVLGRVAARICGMNGVIYTAHGFHFYKGCSLINWVLYYSVERLLARWTDYLITMNNEDYSRAKKFPVRKQVLCMPGVGLDIAKSQWNSGGKFPKEFTISCIAELNKNKNQEQLIRVVDKLVKQGRRVRCLLVGTGKREKRLKALVESLGLQKSIHFLGFRRDIWRLLAETDILALLSRREGLPKVIMEAMAAGKPVVATDIRGNRDLIINGVNGMLVPVADVEETVKAIEALMDDQFLCLSMGRRNLDEVRRYDLKVCLAEVEAIYEKALKLSDCENDRWETDYVREG